MSVAKIKSSMAVAVFAAAFLGNSAFAADEWTGAGDTTSFTNLSNWAGGISATPSGDIGFTEANVTGSKTVTFDDAYSFGGNLHVYAGTESAPIVFKASGDNGLNATVNAEMFIGSGKDNPGHLVLDGGTYTFSNDLNPGWDMSDATLVVKEGTVVHVPYWFRIANGNSTPDVIGTSTVRLEGGEIVAGYRDGAENNNARFAIADRDGSKSGLVMTGGRLRCAGDGDAKTWSFVVAAGARTYGTVTKEGGTIQVDNGDVAVAGGNNSTGIVSIVDGAWTASRDFRIADGENSYGFVEMSGGSLTPSAWFYVGRGNGSYGCLHATGGTINAAVIRIGEGENGNSDVKGLAVNDGGTWTTTGDFRIASDGTRPTGVMTNNSGTVTVGAAFSVGDVASGSGTYVQNGGTLSSTGNFSVGGGANSVSKTEILGGSVNVGGQLWIGNGASANAEMTVSNATVNVASWVAVGREQAGRKGKLVINNGGQVIHTATDNKTHFGIGNLAGDDAENVLIVNDGGLAQGYSDFWVGESGSATMTINEGGTVKAVMADGACRWVIMNKAQSAYATEINLNGGTLETGRITTGGDATGVATVNFNGGTLKAISPSTMILEDLGNLDVKIGAEGGTIDVGSLNVSVSADLDSGVAEGTDGGLTVKGTGILTLSKAANYTGTTYVESGVLAITNGYSFAGAVKVGANGAIAVDTTAAGTELSVDDKIALFSTTGISYDLTDDTLASTVFLFGPVIGYTLSAETVDGVTTVYATVTDVTNISSTRKVTTYIATENYVDQSASWCNGIPSNNSYDVGIFTADAIMYIWGDWKGNVNNIKFGDLVIRGCTAKVMSGNGGYPNIGVKRIAGNGTLLLARAGVVGNGSVDLVSDENVTIMTTVDGVDAGNDSWIGENNASATASTTVNGDVVTSNGFFSIYRNVTFNGDITITEYSYNSYLGGNAGDTVVMNGDLILEQGSTFDFASLNVTFGENARIVLKGGTFINYSAITALPSIVIEEGVYAYGSVPGNGEYTVAGGSLNVVPATDGETFTLTGVTIADGVTASDVIKVTSTQYNWDVSVIESVLTATVGSALDDSVPNYWMGGVEGMWTDAVNWSRGVPTIEQTAEFTYDAVCFYDKKQDLFGEVGKLVLNGHSVTIAAKDYDKQYWGALRIGEFDSAETGTLNVWKAGIWTKNNTALTFPATMKLTFAGTSSDCWLRDDYGDVYVNCPVEIKESDFTLNLDYNVHLQGGVSGPGYITARNKADRNGGCRLIGGDWSEFTGTYTGNSSDKTRFLETFTGSTNATWVLSQYVRFDHASGTVKFGQVTFTDERHIEVIKYSTLVIEVGGLNGNPATGSGTCFYENSSGTEWTDGDAYWSQGSSTAKIKKVGTGTLTCGLVSHATVEVAEGECALSNGDANVNITVDEGAVLYATANVTVDTVSFESGSSIKLNTLDSTPLITATTANVNGVTVTLADGLADTLASQTDPSSYSLLTATTLNGAPNGESVVTCTEEGYVWQPRLNGSVLQLLRRKPISGFFMLFR